jgi:hypothetical protein
VRYEDDDEAKRLNAHPWQLALLKANPAYCSWGPHEDYMIVKGDGWNTPMVKPTWADFAPHFHLDDLNECVNFYFEVNRASEECKACGGNGTHIDAQWVSKSFYSHSSPFKRQSLREQQAEAVMAQFGAGPTRLLGYGGYPSVDLLTRYGTAFREFCDEMRLHGSWADRITEDEAQAIIAKGRAKQGDTAASINARQKGGGFESHDAINRWILIEQRCKRLGLPLHCPACDGHGHVFTEPEAHVSLVLWWLHPRKGCSRGIEIERIQQDDLPAVQAFLKAAAQRNAERFSGLALIA